MKKLPAAGFLWVPTAGFALRMPKSSIIFKHSIVDETRQFYFPPYGYGGLTHPERTAIKEGTISFITVHRGITV
jgi:hypothetical protein